MRTAIASTLLLAILAAAAPASYAQSMAPSDASVAASTAVGASALVVAGSALAAGTLVVMSVQAVGEGTVIVLRSVSSGAITTVRCAGRLAGDIAVIPGTVMVAMVKSSGVDLTVQSRVAAYVPNEAAAALVHSSRASTY